MKYSEFAIEQLKIRLSEKAMRTSTPVKYAGDMLEALEVIIQLQKQLKNVVTINNQNSINIISKNLEEVSGYYGYFGSDESRYVRLDKAIKIVEEELGLS